MAGIDFDRQVFVTPNQPPRKLPLHLMGPSLFLIALVLAGYVGYRIYKESVRASTANNATAEIEQLKQQLVEMQKKLDQAERHRTPTPPHANAASQVQPEAAPKKAAPPKVVYRVDSASKMPAVPKPTASVVTAPPSPANENMAAVRSELAANHEAWQATTDRVADVVGVVDTQQGEITKTREAVSHLLAQSQRKAVSFELQRGTSRMPVGPLALKLKSVDTRNQRYSVRIYFDEKSIELKDRALNEVVVFLLSKDSAPLELVATKILRDQLLGYLAIPVEKQP